MDLVRARRSLRMLAGGLLCALCVRVCSGAEPRVYCGTQQWKPLIAEAAQRFVLPGAWLDAVMRVESAGCNRIKNQPVISPAGALGLMQLTPAVWNRFREQLHLGSDPMDPHDNLFASAGYLRELYDRYGFPGLFAAYHAGPGRYEDYAQGSRSLPDSTIEYLHRIQWSLRSSVLHSNADRLFFRSHANASSSDALNSQLLQDGVFVRPIPRDRKDQSLSRERQP